jgi:hypothetical protein
MFLRGDKKASNLFLIHIAFAFWNEWRFGLNSFKKGITLNKDYIIGKMRGNGAYGAYVPNNTDPHKLSRGFLLQVRKYN